MGIDSIKKGILAGLEEMEDINTSINNNELNKVCPYYVSHKEDEAYIECRDIVNTRHVDWIKQNDSGELYNRYFHKICKGMFFSCANYIKMKKKDEEERKSEDTFDNLSKVNNNYALKTINNDKVIQFDYSLIDEDTACFLQDKAYRIIEIRIKSVIAIGKEFKEAQERLANHYQGSFQQWVKSLGITPKTAYNYINGYEYVVKNFHNIEDAEKIQPSLLFAISKPSAPLELQQAVISGDITTHKQYKELEQKLKMAELEAQEKHRLYETISQSYDRLEKKNHEHYEKLKAMEKELEHSRRKVEELEFQINDSDSIDSKEIATAVVEIEKVPDETLAELEELRRARKSNEVNAEIKALLKILNSSICDLGEILINMKDKNHVLDGCKSYIDQVKDSLLLLKRISMEQLDSDLFYFIRD